MIDIEIQYRINQQRQQDLMREAEHFRLAKQVEAVSFDSPKLMDQIKQMVIRKQDHPTVTQHAQSKIRTQTVRI